MRDAKVSFASPHNRNQTKQQNKTMNANPAKPVNTCLYLYEDAVLLLLLLPLRQKTELQQKQKRIKLKTKTKKRIKLKTKNNTKTKIIIK